MSTLKGIVTHPRPHFDEMMAIFFLYLFGKKKFLNIEEVINSDQIHFYREESLPDYIKNDLGSYIFLGVGSGLNSIPKYLFDEHPAAGEKRENKETCATLVAKFLGVDNDPILSTFLKEVVSVDLHGNGGDFHLSSTIKRMFEQNYKFPTVLQSCMTIMTLVYNNQCKFHSCGEDFQKAHKFTVNNGQREIRVVIGETENIQFATYCRSEFGEYQDLIVQKNPSGNVQIFTRRPSNEERRNGARDIDLSDLVRVLRIVEMTIVGQSFTPSAQNWEGMVSERVDGAGSIWYFSKAGILNGSLTADVEPTKIPFDEFDKLVQVSLGNSFPSDRVESCSRGVCTHSKSNCIFYKYGLTRCRKIHKI